MDGRGLIPARAIGRNPAVVGRYAVFDVIATGGMATVHFGRLLGPAGFSRTVVVKRLHAQYVGDPELGVMLRDEARVAARIRHTNVVNVIDVVEERDELLLVMEYVHGESLAYLLRADGARGPARTRLVGNVVAGALLGLHAAHEAMGENNQPLGVVHRDFSPQNILVGVDGTARVLDFGVAKAAGQAHHTGAGKVKGKIRYLAPEQVTCGSVDRRADLWAAAVMLWEAVTGKRLFSGEHDAGVLLQILDRSIPSPSEICPDVPEAISQVVMRGLQRDRTKRFSTALEMATALEEAVGLLPPRELGAWVERLARGRLAERRHVLDDIEAETLAGTLVTMGDPERVPHTPWAHGARSFAVTTETALVRESSVDPGRPTVTEPAVRRRHRAPAIAWGAAATLVVLIAGGVGGRLLSRMELRPVMGTAGALTSLKLTLPGGTQPEAVPLAAAEPATSAAPAAAPASSASATPSAEPPKLDPPKAPARRPAHLPRGIVDPWRAGFAGRQ